VRVLKATHKYNKRGYEYLAYCNLEKWTSRQTKAIYQLAGEDGTFWYELRHKVETGKPYLERRLPELDQYNLQWNEGDKTDSDEEPTQDKGKNKADTEYESDSTNHQPTKEHHSTDNKLNKEASIDASIIQNSPISTQPTLSPTILTTMSTTLIQPTIMTQATNVASTTSPPPHLWKSGNS